MSKPIIGLQIYSIRDELKTKESFTHAMKKVAEAGYTAIEIAGIGADVTDEEIKAICDEAGLKIISAHIMKTAFDDDFEGTVKKLKTWGAECVALPVPPADIRESGDFSKFAKETNELGAKLAEEGITLSYHNHSFEFQKYDGKLGIETLYAETDAANLKTQLDVCWVQRGGGSVVTYIEKYAGRMPTIHFKDHTIVDNDFYMTPVGEGNLDWPNIAKAAEAAGAQYFIVEQDDTHGDPFGSIASSYAFLKGLGYN